MAAGLKNSSYNTRTHTYTYKNTDCTCCRPELDNTTDVEWESERPTNRLDNDNLAEIERERENFDRIWLSHKNLSSLSLRLLSQSNRNTPKREHTYTYDYTHVCSCMCACKLVSELYMCKRTQTVQKQH